MNPSFDIPISRLQTVLQPEMHHVNQLIVKSLDSAVPLIGQIANHLIWAGGKRIRPLLTLACNRLFAEPSGGTPDFSMHLAAAVELIHTATLLHDDVVDGADLRRGLQTANTLWGNTGSVLVGDFLFSRSFQLMVGCGNLEVLGELSAAAAQIASGEVLQLVVSHDLNLTIDMYRDVIASKTAALFAAACKVGGMIAPMPKDLEDDLYKFGHNLGMAFQVMDDVLDYTVSQGGADKEKGNDFFEGKVTIPVILAVQGNRNPQFWQDCFTADSRNQGDFLQAMGLLHEQGILDDCRGIARDFAQKAKESLLKMPDCSIRDDLLALIAYSYSRES